MAPLNTWKDITQQKQYIEWLGKELGYKSMEDWYKITKDDFSKNYGGGFLQTSYNNNYQELFKAIFPEYKWLPWKFNLTPKNYFTKQENLQSYMKWLGKELEYNTMEDWYNLTTPILEKHYGYSLLTLYNYSVPSILKHTYPDYSWVTYKFICVPNGYWKKKSNRFHYMEFLRDRLGYKTLDDFYNISCELLSNNYGGTLLNYYNSNPIHILLDVYPEYNWDITKFNKRYSNMSTEVMSFIENLFGIHIQHGIDEYKIPDTRYSVDGFHKETNTIYEFHGDFWHGAEYLQIQHAKNNKIHELLKQRFGRTKLREQFIKNKGYNLIVIWEHEWYNGDALSNLYNKILFE
jgi:G:T-mismatch repair DNA endonuclease (very short patch repair protein)